MVIKIEKIDDKVNISGLIQDQVYYLIKDTFEALKKNRKEGSMLFDVHPNRNLIFDLMKHLNPIRPSVSSLILEIKEFFNSL